METMDISCIKKLFECKFLQNIFDKVYIIDLDSHCCIELDTIELTTVKSQSFENWLISFSEKMYKLDSIAFLEQMDLKQIYDSLTEEKPCYIVYCREIKETCIQEYRLNISYAEESQAKLIILREKLSKSYPSPLGTMDKLSHWNDRFQFLVNRLTEDFIEVQVETGICHMFHSDNGMKKYNMLKDQIIWWAEHLIVPEEREAYIKEYELENLLKNLRANNGYHSMTYTTLSSNIPNNLLIISMLVKENYGKAEEYIFAYCQDITPLKVQETRNKQLVDISQQLLTLSQTEPVTNLLNRAACEKLIEKHLATIENEVPGTMLLIDVDHFKKFNDEYGHSMGDFILKFLGKTMRDIFRSDDIVSRWGGDEFVVFMRDVCDKRIVEGRIECLQSRLCQCKKETLSLPITISVGGKIAKTGMTGKILFDYCDKALYQVKSRGRNHYFIDSD